MDTTLVTVTILSMGMAAALSVIVWRLLREERRRSDARVAALAAAAAPLPRRTGPSSQPATADAIPPKIGHQRARVHREPPVASAFTRRAPEDADDLFIHDQGSSVPTGALFAEAPQASPWGNRLAVMAGIALLLASAVFVAMMASHSSAPASVRKATTAPATDPAPAGLELLSLRDAREAGTLTITGMVQNPRTGRLLSRVAVTAYAFDDKGAFLASGRALLDVTSLAPGDDSPFVVTVPVTETVARYRIGFRGEDGRVIAHVDKRQTSPIAANWSRQ